MTIDPFYSGFYQGVNRISRDVHRFIGDAYWFASSKKADGFESRLKAAEDVLKDFVVHARGKYQSRIRSLEEDIDRCRAVGMGALARR